MATPEEGLGPFSSAWGKLQDVMSGRSRYRSRILWRRAIRDSRKEEIQKDTYSHRTSSWGYSRNDELRRANGGEHYTIGQADKRGGRWDPYSPIAIGRWGAPPSMRADTPTPTRHGMSGVTDKRTSDSGEKTMFDPPKNQRPGNAPNDRLGVSGSLARGGSKAFAPGNLRGGGSDHSYRAAYLARTGKEAVTNPAGRLRMGLVGLIAVEHSRAAAQAMGNMNAKLQSSANPGGWLTATEPERAAVTPSPLNFAASATGGMGRTGLRMIGEFGFGMIGLLGYTNFLNNYGLMDTATPAITYALKYQARNEAFLEGGLHGVNVLHAAMSIFGGSENKELYQRATSRAISAGDSAIKQIRDIGIDVAERTIGVNTRSVVWAMRQGREQDIKMVQDAAAGRSMDTMLRELRGSMGTKE